MFSAKLTSVNWYRSLISTLYRTCRQRGRED